MRSKMRWPVLLLGAALAMPLAAQEFYVYPNQGQTAEKQKQEEFECYNWAKNQTGFDPMQRPQATTAPPKNKQSTASAGRGIIGGAAGGAIIGGATGGDVGKSAAIGAVAGGLFGNSRRNRQQSSNQQKQDEWAQREAQNYEAQRREYNRAYAACLEGRGYTVR